MASRDQRRKSTERAWFITAPLALLAIVFSTAIGVLRPEFGEWGLAFVLFVAMTGISIPVLNVIVRRQSVGVTLTEVPLVVALFFLPPLTVVLIYTLSVLIWSASHRFAPAKLWFNVAKAAAATSLAGLLLLALPPINGVGPGTWGSLFLAVNTITLVSLLSVAGVHVLLQGWQAGREALRTAPSVFLTTSINASVGLLVLIALKTTWWSVLLLAALFAALFQVYRSYSQFFRQHRTLTEHVRADPAAPRAGRRRRAARRLLGRVRRLLQAEYATLWLPRPAAGTRRCC